MRNEGDRRTKTDRGEADRSALKRGARAIAAEEVEESSLVGQKIWDEVMGSVGTIVEVREETPYKGMVVVDYGGGENVVRSVNDIQTEADMEQEIAWRQRVLEDLRIG